MRRAGAVAAGSQDSSDLPDRPFDVVVHHDCVECVGPDPLLGLGPGQPPRDGLLGLAPPGLEAPPLLLPARSQKEN